MKCWPTSCQWHSSLRQRKAFRDNNVIVHLKGEITLNGPVAAKALRYGEHLLGIAHFSYPRRAISPDLDLRPKE